MNDILELLRGGDLRSDGSANEVVQIIRENHFLINNLLDGLETLDDIVRGRTADALEKISREFPELLLLKLPELLVIARNDPVPMVRWHAVMIVTNLLAMNQRVNEIEATLKESLDDPSAFVRSWSITGLCILGRMHPDKKQEILTRLSIFDKDSSIAVRHRAARAIRLLLDQKSVLPPGWLKSSRINLHR